MVCGGCGKNEQLSFIKSHMLVTSWCFTSYQITFFTVTWPESAAAAAESFQITCFALLGCSLYWFVRATRDAKAMLTLTVSHQDERKWNCYILKNFMWLHQQMVAYLTWKFKQDNWKSRNCFIYTKGLWIYPTGSFPITSFKAYSKFIIVIRFVATSGGVNNVLF